MFVVETPAFDYKDPWDTGLNDRLKKLWAGGGRAIAYLYEQADNSTFRYRAFNPAQHFEMRSDYFVSYFFANEIEALTRNLDSIGLLIVCRCRYTHVLGDFVALCRRKGIKVLYDVDDMVFDTELVHLIVDTLAQDLAHPGVWDHWYAYIGRLGAALELADGVCSTNEYLMSAMVAKTNKPGFIVPNFLNDSQLEISERIYLEKCSRNFDRNNQLHIGYFSGTPSHANDFLIAKSAIIDIMEQKDHVCLFVVGYLDISDLKQKFGSRIIQYPIHDFVNLQRLISLAEINIVPLQNNRFTNAKSELKFFEASIVGSLTLATPTLAYAQSIKDGETGLLVEDWEWHEKLTDVIENYDDYIQLAPAARDYCLQTYAGDTITSKLEAVYRQNLALAHSGRHGASAERTASTRVASMQLERGLVRA